MRRVLGWSALALTLPGALAVKGAGRGRKVIVVGAGLSGLAAAATLKASDFEVIVLESRDRLGGRVFTDRSIGNPVELGANWIQGVRGNPLMEIAKRSAARPVVTDDDSIKVFDAKAKAVSEDKLDRAETDYDELLELIEEKTAKLDDDITLAAAIHEHRAKAVKDPLMVWLLGKRMEWEAGGPIEELSAWEWHGGEAFSGGDAVIPQGFDSLVNYLAQGIDVRLKQQVTHIAHDSKGVTVKTAKEELKADFVIVTLPLGVLQNHAVTFEPALTAGREEAIRSIGVGHVNTVAMVWDVPFWDLQTQFYGSVSPEKGRYPVFFNCRTAGRANALLTWGVGTHGKRMESQTDKQIQEDVLEQLNQIFPGRVTPPTRTFITRWGKDPHSMGSWSFPTVATTRAHVSELGEPIANRAFFAGEHTSLDHRGTAHGAYMTGLREARRILAFNA